MQQKKCYRRKLGFLPRKSGGYLALYATKDTQKILLNPAAALLWQLADGKSTLETIYIAVQEQVSNKQMVLEEQITAGLSDLVLKGLIEEMDAPKPALPIIKVGFCNFWDTFDIYDNYFLLALATQFTVYVVDFEKETPNLLFFGPSPSVSILMPNHQMVNRKETLKIGLFTELGHIDFDNFDFGIITFEHPSAKRLIYVPTWAIYYDWQTTNQLKDKLPLVHSLDLTLFEPQKLGSQIVALLKSSVIPSDKEIKTNFPNVNRPTLTKNDGKIADFSKIKKGHLTIGMATYDDYDGVYFTLQSIRLHHPEILDKLSFIVIDNNPNGEVGKALKALSDWIKNIHYIPFQAYNSTAVRDLIFREATTEYVMSLDSHVLLAPNSLKKLIDWLDEHPDCMDLLQGPMIYDDLTSFATNIPQIWSKGLYGGAWHTDSRGEDSGLPPFEIIMHGLGAFACRKEAWLGFNPRFRGFGGEEGYIHEKFRQAGRKTICLPFFRWLHRFGRPDGTKYSAAYKDRIRNYLIGFEELGWDTTSVRYYFSQILGRDTFNQSYRTIQLELKSPFIFFDAVYFIYPAENSNNWGKMLQYFEKFYLHNIIRPYPVNVSSSEIHYDQEREKIVGQSIKNGFNHVCILDDKAVLIPAVVKHLAKLVKKIQKRNWKTLYIGNPIDFAIHSNIFETAYVAKSNRPEDSHISAHHLVGQYDLALALKNQKETTIVQQSNTL